MIHRGVPRDGSAKETDLSEPHPPCHLPRLGPLSFLRAKKPKRDRKKTSGGSSKLAIKIKDKGGGSGGGGSAAAKPAAAVPDLLGGDLLSSDPAPAPAPAAAGGGFGDMFAAPPIAATNGSGFDGFDPRGGSSAAAAPAVAVPTPVAAAPARGGGGGLFGQEFSGFSAAPAAAPAAAVPAAQPFGAGGAVSSRCGTR